MKPFKRYAFFDLDNTLITVTSITAFFKYYLDKEHTGEAEMIWKELSHALKVQLNNNVAREEINTWFYRKYFNDLQICKLKEHAINWLQECYQDCNFFIQPVVDQLRLHQANDTGIVIVTGSFREIVRPLTYHLDAQAYICAPLEEQNGRYTGKLIAPPTIGEGKSTEVKRFIAHSMATHTSCYAYGDDHSDIPFLRCVGHPCALSSGSQYLLDHAAANNWNILPCPAE